MTTIVGVNDTKETLTGTNDDDVIVGGAGTNTLSGKDGADTFVIGARPGVFSSDAIKDFQRGIDKIDISALGISSFSQMKPLLMQSNIPVVTGLGVMTNFNSRGFSLENVKLSTLSADDFIFDTSKSTLDAATDGYDTLFGTAGDDTMIAVEGEFGNDELYGGDGNDHHGRFGQSECNAVRRRWQRHDDRRRQCPLWRERQRYADFWERGKATSTGKRAPISSRRQRVCLASIIMEPAA